jgi:hypothetical protein
LRSDTFDKSRDQLVDEPPRFVRYAHADSTGGRNRLVKSFSGCFVV